MKYIAVLVSGNGSNLQAIIDRSLDINSQFRIELVICNSIDAYAIERVNNINNSANTAINLVIMDSYKNLNKTLTRIEYDEIVLNYIKRASNKIDLVVLAGWMHILGSEFLNNLNNLHIDIINLHPAKSGQFAGANAIHNAFDAFKAGQITETGIMVHYVIPEIDAGKVIIEIPVPIYNIDTFETLKKRINLYEKAPLLYAIGKVLNISIATLHKVNSGKVRDIIYNPIIKPTYKLDKFNKLNKVYEVYEADILELHHSDRLSSFDRYICDIPQKGYILNKISTYWFNSTAHIINNHYISSTPTIMYVKNCEVIPIEFVIRAYITGTTKTSLWVHYNNGSREYCGIKLPDGLVKNQKLEKCIITPTTKGDVDEPISPDEIIKLNILTQTEWEYISKKCLELFEYVSKSVEKCDLILVDTKLEFGRNLSNEIILIDEAFTCDSSRYWKKSSYENGIIQNFDKDIIRNWISTKCDPYNDPLPDIPNELIQQVSNIYIQFYNNIINNK